MRTLIDFSPLHRSGIGFDRVFDMLETAARTPNTDNWPPFDSVRLGEDSYRLTMAVAGFSEEEIEISAQANLLVVSGEHKGEPEGEYLHRGIANRPFSRRFELADHVKVVGARLANGLLSIDLQREVPEAMKPRRIAINTTAPQQAAPVQKLHNEAA